MISKTKLTTAAILVSGILGQNAFALEAWHGQEGSDTFEVIFDGQVYTNSWCSSLTFCLER